MQERATTDVFGKERAHDRRSNDIFVTLISALDRQTLRLCNGAFMFGLADVAAARATTAVQGKRRVKRIVECRHGTTPASPVRAGDLPLDLQAMCQRNADLRGILHVKMASIPSRNGIRKRRLPET
jgi:hypothetical protein